MCCSAPSRVVEIADNFQRVHRLMHIEAGWWKWCLVTVFLLAYLLRDVLYVWVATKPKHESVVKTEEPPARAHGGKGGGRNAGGRRARAGPG